MNDITMKSYAAKVINGVFVVGMRIDGLWTVGLERGDILIP